MSLISVIIPTLNAEETLVQTLSSLMPAVVQGQIKEVILVDTGSMDSTLEIAESTGCRVIRVEQGRGLELWQGCKEAKGDWLLILHSDSVLSENWLEAALSHIKKAPLRAGYFTLRFEPPSLWTPVLERLVALRAQWLALPSGDHGLFMSRALYESAGGYKAADSLEELNLTMALGRFRLRQLPKAEVSTSLKRFVVKGSVWAMLRTTFSVILHVLGFPMRPKA